MTKTYFTEEEALQMIKDELNNYDDIDDMKEDLSNEYIVYFHEAEKALRQYGTFEALGIVRDYEKENFGEIFTDFSDSVDVANALWSIIIEEIFSRVEDLKELAEAIEEGSL